MDYELLTKNFNLLKAICKQASTPDLKVDLHKIEKIINEVIPQALEKNAPPNFPELLFDFKGEYERFRDFILYDQLIGKNIVALGGGFSSGKSTFLNALMKRPLLPAEINPSTSVPAYIVSAKEESVYGINVFDTKLALEVNDIKVISHGFGEMDEEEGPSIEEVTLGHILKSLFISTPSQTFENIAFLDTPGYSKPDTANYSAKTDEKIARTQLNSSSFIMWFIQADAGTITQEDIKFINTLEPSIPKLFIVNKADKKTEKDLALIIEKIKELLAIKGIQYVDVLAYARPRKSNPNAYDTEKIVDLLQKWNSKVEKVDFAYQFKALFVKCKGYYDNELQEEGKRLNRLNKAITLAEDEEVRKCISSLSKDISKNVTQLKAIMIRLKDLQNDFFTEIKMISDRVGIEMPEPSEIDLLGDKTVNPLKIIKAYKKKYGIKDNEEVRQILEDLKGVKHTINKQKGGSAYQAVLLALLEDTIKINQTERVFNKIDKNIEDMKKMIENTIKQECA